MTEARVGEDLREERADEGIPQRLGIAALAHDAAVYGAARIFLKSLAFLLVPLYAHYLAPSDFGRLELVLAVVALVDVFINLSGVLARFYFDRDEAGWRRRVITVFLLIETVYPAVLVGGLIAASGLLSKTLFDSRAYAVFFVIAFADLYLTNIVDVPMALARLRRKPYTFAAYSVARGLIQVVASVLLVAVWGLGVKGVLIASLASVGAAFLFTAREYIHDLTRAVSRRLAREMIAFGWPTVISALAFFSLNLLDRFFVNHYHGVADNGLYGVAFRYSQLVLVAVLAFRLGWPQWHYSWLASGRHPEMVARGANYYFAAIGFVAVGVAAWILPVFRAILPEAYWDASRAVAPLGLSAAAAGAYTVFAAGLNVTKRMRLIAPTALVSATIAIGLYFLLIPPFSYVGAAWATAAAMATLALTVLAVSQRVYPVPWDWRRITFAAGLTAALSLAALALDAWVPFAPSLPLRVAVVAFYPVLLVAAGFFPTADLAAARARVSRRPRGRSGG